MSYHRILIWEVNWIGDVLFSTPFIRAIRKKFPDARITCVSTPRTKEVLETNPNIDDILVFDEKNINRGLFEKWRMIRRLRKKRFDIVFLLHRSLTRALICALSGITQRIGYSYRKRDFLLTHKTKAPDGVAHKIEYFLGLARKAGAESDGVGMDFYFTDDDRLFVENFFKVNKIAPGDAVIAVNPGGNWGPKRWPVEKYAELCCQLTKKFNAKVVVTGGDKDVDLYLRIQDLCHEKLLSLSGKTTLRQLGAFLSRCDVIISGDSGPMHIALALRRKTVALFGPTSHALTGPFGSGDYIVVHRDIGCKVPCYVPDCQKNRCMEAITVDDVVGAVSKLIGKI
jgi:lipopolysaccharide heptosyltransferase II